VLAITSVVTGCKTTTDKSTVLDHPTVDSPSTATSLSSVTPGADVLFAANATQASGSFDVPTATFSFQYVLSGAPDEGYRWIELVEPDGNRLIENGVQRDIPNPPGGVVGNTLAVIVPNKPNYKVKPGRWTFKVERAGLPEALQRPSTVKAALVTKEAPNKVTAAKLRVHYWFFDGDAITAENAASNPEFAKITGTFVAAYAAAGIGIVPSYGRLPASLNIAYSFENLGKLVESVPRDDDAINVVFGKMIPILSVVAGLSTHLPGPVKVRGASGIILMNGAGRVDTPQARGLVLAHEVGHYLGLQHTDVDTLDDTENSPTNLMYPDTVTPWAKFSEQQTQLLLYNPIIEFVP